MVDRVAQAKALANESRMAILSWLREPKKHFSHQLYADPEDPGVCVTMLTEKLGTSQPTVSRHLELLRQAGFVRVNRVERWSFYQRDDAALDNYRRWLAENL